MFFLLNFVVIFKKYFQTLIFSRKIPTFIQIIRACHQLEKRAILFAFTALFPSWCRAIHATSVACSYPSRERTGVVQKFPIAKFRLQTLYEFKFFIYWVETFWYENSLIQNLQSNFIFIISIFFNNLHPTAPHLKFLN